MWSSFQRLVLGVLLITATSALLLISDLGSRVKPSASPGQPGGTVAPTPRARTVRIAVLQHASQLVLDQGRAGFFVGLAGQGWEQGRNVTLKYYNAEGDMPVAQAIAKEMAGGGYDLLVTNIQALVTFSTPVLQTALTMAKRKPVVFTYVTDPLTAGAGKTYEDHHPNFTGIGSLPPIDDTISIVRRALPHVKTIGTIYNSGEANSIKIISMLRESARRAGLNLAELTAASSNEVLQAMQALVTRRIDIFYMVSDNTAYLAFDAILKVAGGAKLPVIIDDPDYVDKGALFACGPGYYHSGKAAAPLLARVLAGESPAKIPMANVSVNTTKFNPAIITQLGLKIAPELIREIETAGTTKSAAGHPNPSGKKWKIAVQLYAENPHAEESLKGIRDQLKRGALVDGRDYEIKVRSAQNDAALLNGIFDAAITDRSDLFVPFSTQTLQVAAQKVKQKPIVFTAVSAPVAAGVAKSFTDHLPNVTGVCTIAPYSEMFDVLDKFFPTFKRLGTLYAPGETGSTEMLEEYETLCRARGFTLVPVAASSLSDVSEAAVALMSRPIDAVVQMSDNIAFAGFGSIARAARTARKPLFSINPTMITQGAAAAVGRDYTSAGEAAAVLIERVIRGEDPSTMPIVLPPRHGFPHISGPPSIMPERIRVAPRLAGGLNFPPCSNCKTSPSATAR